MKIHSLAKLTSLLLVFLAVAPAAFAQSAAVPVTVGTKGNEPIVAVGPDGTLYISALQHIYNSTNGGLSWSELPGTPLSSTANLNSDSSISVDPGGRLYFTFDYPYAGSTAVCVSDDKGVTFTCNPAVVPGGTDRMWITAPKINAAYEVTNEALYQTTFLTSTDRGATFLPAALGTALTEPQTGPLLQRNCSSFVVQPIKIYGNGPADEEVKLYVYDPTAPTNVTTAIRPLGLKLPTALPGGAFGLDGALYVASEELNPAGGKQIVVARSFDEGVTVTKLPPIPATLTGTATFTWVAAGAPGHIGVIYYYTPDNGDPGTLNSTWSTMWAESYNANTAAPTWTSTKVDDVIHTGAICVAASCMGADRFSGDFINAIIDKTGAAHLTWVKQDSGATTTTVRYARIQSAAASTYVPVPCGTTVVSRKTHRNTDYDVDLPFVGTPGVEPREGGASGDHKLVFTFATPLLSVDAASVTSGAGTVSHAVIGADAHQYIVDLTGVGNAQTITVGLTNVKDSSGTVTSLISAFMNVLLGDTNGDGTVNSGDAQQTRNRSGQLTDAGTFRSDVNLDGTINSGDAFLVRRQSGTP